MIPCSVGYTPSFTIVTSLYPIYEEEKAMVGGIAELGGIRLLAKNAEIVDGSISSVGGITITTIVIRYLQEEPIMTMGITEVSSIVITPPFKKWI